VVGDHVLTQGKDTIATEPTKTLAVVSSKCSGGIFSEHWIDGQRCGPLQGAIAEKAVPFPSVARRSQFFLCSTRFTGVPSRPVQRDRDIASRAAGKARQSAGRGVMRASCAMEFAARLIRFSAYGPSARMHPDSQGGHGR
jgi:hypothetical protein